MQKTSTENPLNQQSPSQSVEIVEKTAVEASKNMCVVKAHNITPTTQLENPANRCFVLAYPNCLSRNHGPLLAEVILKFN